MRPRKAMNWRRVSVMRLPMVAPEYVAVGV
jgi:hypothetical protein